MLFGTAKATLGDHWEPTSDERTGIATATAAYARSVNMVDIPPGIALCICVGLYAAPRIAHPETGKRLHALGVRFGLAREKPPEPKPRGEPRMVTSDGREIPRDPVAAPPKPGSTFSAYTNSAVTPEGA